MRVLKCRRALPHGTRRWLVVPVATLGLLAAPMGLLAGPAVANTVALQNGSFENGTYVDSCGGGCGYDTLYSGGPNASAITGWTVTAGSVDWIKSYWTAEDGTYSLDMNGTGTDPYNNETAAGTIQQTFATVSGDTYFVQFWLAGNPDGGPATKTLWVDATGGTSMSYSFTNTSSTTNANMGWLSEGYTFTATGASTTLSFSADPGNTSNNGPALDNVSVTQIVTNGAQCKNGGWQGQTDPDTGAPYQNQGQCVSYFATKGATPIGS